MTLVELLVVMLLMGIIGTFTATALVNGMQETDDVDRRVVAYGELQQGGARMSRELRAAQMTCTGTSLGAFTTSVIVDRGGDRYRYTYSLPTGSEEVTLDLDRWDTATSAWVDVSSGAVIVEVDNHALGQDLFVFLDGDGVATTEPRDVRTIRLNLRRQAPDDSILVEQAVNLRNGGLPCPSA